MKGPILPSLALLAALLGMTACGTKTMPAAASAQELKVQADDVTLHARIAGNPDADDVVLAVNMGPGLSSHYMASLEQLAGESLAVVTYDQRPTGCSRGMARNASGGNSRRRTSAPGGQGNGDRGPATP